ncbi:TetR/AcrR family transcriptional regulator [Streptomyces xanthophaeus]|uniref:TetR/AcrR family transcriptional regulator n=1 Tax=Streptomyces xanthophaeus TaxID=67385 RepID=UPI002647B45F|nr:TetR/AcrR family transcriptional regulator [Streptomyces xanthophaeus]WKD32864.1 TetR/AcrR family transcriptional regulator [Streptomyces xanthophaeus]
MDDEEARTRLLDAAEELFYRHGIQAVGMDRIRTASGVPLKRLYRVFPAKESLVTAYLERRDRRWLDSLRTAALAPARPRARVLAVFDWLADWFTEPDFRGCAFLNAYGELGAAAPEIVRIHKAELHTLLADLTADPTLADRLLILTEGATAVAALTPGPEPAHRAREIAELLLGE